MGKSSALHDMLRLGVILMIFCAVAGLALAKTYDFTEERIAAQQEEELHRALKDAVPEAEDFETMEKDGHTVYLGRANGNLMGIVVVSEAQGYGGPIKMFVATDESGVVKKAIILSLSETPGLGMKVDDPKFLSQFEGKGPDDAFLVKKDVQAISGATVSSRAVATAVKEAVSVASSLKGSI
ncbi:MAG TPA: RnfABCDGE type electron transport complex subunit G [Clostridia bacterium]|nr:RnfABCDGE type electron transport complex subunit G [Clostridia bacterium]